LTIVDLLELLLDLHVVEIWHVDVGQHRVDIDSSNLVQEKFLTDIELMGVQLERVDVSCSDHHERAALSDSRLVPASKLDVRRVAILHSCVEGHDIVADLACLLELYHEVRVLVCHILAVRPESEISRGVSRERGGRPVYPEEGGGLESGLSMPSPPLEVELCLQLIASKCCRLQSFAVVNTNRLLVIVLIESGNTWDLSYVEALWCVADVLTAIGGHNTELLFVGSHEDIVY